MTKEVYDGKYLYEKAEGFMTEGIYDGKDLCQKRLMKEAIYDEIRHESAGRNVSTEVSSSFGLIHVNSLYLQAEGRKRERGVGRRERGIIIAHNFVYGYWRGEEEHCTHFVQVLCVRDGG
jgi:hypothetical protein